MFNLVFLTAKNYANMQIFEINNSLFQPKKEYGAKLI